MDALPNFDVIRPTSIAEVLAARRAHPASRLLGGGTDLVVNIRRGIEAPPVLIAVNEVAELRAIQCDEHGLSVGASVRLAELAGHAGVRKLYPAVAEAAESIAGPTHREMGTVGGNICLDTRCIYYNQSDWWRSTNAHCLKTVGAKCHVAPKSKGVCFATFSGDLAPAFLVYGAQVDLLGPEGERTVPLAGLYTGYARQDGSTGDGKRYLALKPGEFVLRLRARQIDGLVTGYDKMRIRRSIEYPVAGVAVGLKRSGGRLDDLRIAVTGTNPRPVLLEGAERLCGGALDDTVLAGIDELGRDQIMSMKTTFTPGMYRRRVAIVLAKRLAQKLWARAGA